MKKHLEIKTFESYGINIHVKIDYDRQTISLVDEAPAYENKKWLFANRDTKYINGWHNILNAMKYAIEQAEAELTEYLAKKQEEKDKDITEILMKATEIVNGEKFGVLTKKKRK